MPALPSMITALLCSLFLSDYRSEFPCRTIRIINDHVDEVWFCRFSPDGKRLATGSKDGKLMIWDIDQVNITLYFVFMHYLHMRLVSEFTYTAMCSNVMRHTVLICVNIPRHVTWNVVKSGESFQTAFPSITPKTNMSKYKQFFLRQRVRWMSFFLSFS